LMVSSRSKMQSEMATVTQSFVRCWVRLGLLMRWVNSRRTSISGMTIRFGSRAYQFRFSKVPTLPYSVLSIAHTGSERCGAAVEAVRSLGTRVKVDSARDYERGSLGGLLLGSGGAWLPTRGSLGGLLFGSCGAGLPTRGSLGGLFVCSGGAGLQTRGVGWAFIRFVRHWAAN